MSPRLPEIRLRPVTEADLSMFRRFVVEPGLIGLDWSAAGVARPGNRLARAGDFLLLSVREHARSANRGGHARREHRRTALTGKSRVHPRGRHPRGRVPGGPMARRLPLQPPAHRHRPPRGLEPPRSRSARSPEHGAGGAQPRDRSRKSEEISPNGPAVPFRRQLIRRLRTVASGGSGW